MGSERDVLMRRARRIVAEIDQIESDAQHWNAIHPDQPPLDYDPDGTLRAARALMMRMLGASEP